MPNTHKLEATTLSGKDISPVLNNSRRLSAKEAADYLGINERTLANMRCKGAVTIPFFRYSRRKIIYFEADLANYVASNYHEPDTGND